MHAFRFPDIRTSGTAAILLRGVAALLNNLDAPKRSIVADEILPPNIHTPCLPLPLTCRNIPIGERSKEQTDNKNITISRKLFNQFTEISSDLFNVEKMSRREFMRRFLQAIE